MLYACALCLAEAAAFLFLLGVPFCVLVCQFQLLDPAPGPLPACDPESITNSE